VFKCKVCGKEFEGRQKSKANKYCSKKCQFLGSRKRTDKTCRVCGKVFVTHICRKKTAKYCSLKCQHKSMNKKIEYSCLQCGKLFLGDSTRPRKYCSIQCRYKHWIGKDSPSWLGGKSYEPYTPDFNGSLKAKIKLRDKYECQICGLLEKDKKLPFNIHHIDYDKNNSKESNLILLCHRCHLKTNNSRTKWKEFFMEKKGSKDGQ
jgi:endogenous inhibitor of DNA gyrase (YacG/DUF329 family)